jgi:hypothetical protein
VSDSDLHFSMAAPDTQHGLPSLPAPHRIAAEFYSSWYCLSLAWHIESFEVGWMQRQMDRNVDRMNALQQFL